MKTNIQIIIDDDERLDLGRKYHDTQNKHLITRDELRTIVHEFMQEILDSDQTVKKTTDEVVSTGAWRKIYYYEGEINMFGAVGWLVDNYGLEKSKASEIFKTWTKTFEEGN